MDCLRTEAQSRPDSQELLCKSNHLCALLKQMAVATKKAALHFPDKVAIQEAVDFAKELSQRAHHFRMSLDVWGGGSQSSYWSTFGLQSLVIMAHHSGYF